MNPITYRITLDLLKTGCQHVLSGIKVGDSNRRLEIRLTEGGVPYPISKDSYAQIRFNRPDGTIFTDLCQKEGNVIKYTIDSAVLSSKGEYEADIQLGNADGESFASSEFLLLAYEAVVDDSKASEDVYHSLIQAIADAESNMVKDAKVDADGNLIVSLDGGKEINAGNVMGPRGPVGPAGPEGEKGDKGDSAPPDYNLVANALKGSAEGNPIRLDDVSPLEHEIAVGLKSKNLFPYPYSITSETINGVTFTDNGNGTITANGTATAAAQFSFISTVKIPRGNYFFGANIGNTNPDINTMFALRKNGVVIAEGRDTGAGVSLNLQEEANEIFVSFLVRSGQTANNFVFKPQLELGSTATAYAPFVDFTKDYMVGGIVTDTNFSFPSETVSYTEDTFVQVTGANTSNNGTLTFNNGDVWRGSGQLTSSIDGNLGEAFSVGDLACISPSKVGDASILELHKATKVDKTVQRYGKNLCEDVSLNGVVITGNGTSNPIHKKLNAHFPDSDTPVTVSTKFTAKDVTFSSNGLFIFCGVIFADGTTSYLGLASTDNYSQGFGSFTVNKKIAQIDVSQQARWTSGTITIDYIQVEEGTTATDFEPYVEPTTYTADENGNVAVPSLAPTTVLMEGEGVIAKAEYNKDINKAFEEIYQAIATMGAAAVAIPEEV